jgi:hypothetical protein
LTKSPPCDEGFGEAAAAFDVGAPSGPCCRFAPGFGLGTAVESVLGEPETELGLEELGVGVMGWGLPINHCSQN